MNLNEVKKHIFFQLIIYILIGICFLLSLIVILITPTKAAELVSNDITTGIANVSVCGVKSNGYYCIGQGSSTFDKVAINSNYIYAVNWIGIDLNNTIPYFSNAPSTIEIYSSTNSFTNSSYSCSWGGNNQPVTCTVSRVSSGRININYRSASTGGSPQYLYINIGSENPTTWLDGIKISKVVSLQSVQDPNASVIENQNQNTSDIINNNNENTQSINNSLNDLMNVQNLTSDDNINMQREQLNSLCSNSYKFNFAKGKAFYSNGSLYNSSLSFYTEEYIPIGSGVTRLYIQNANDNGTAGNIILYDNNKNYLDYWGVRNQNFTLPNGATYFRIASTYPGVLVTKNSACVKTEDKIYSYLEDDSNPNVNQSGIDDVLSEVEVTDPLNYLLTLPISLLQKLNTVLSANTCSRVSFGSLYNTELYLPCINFAQILGSSIWGTIDLIVGVGLLAIILKKFYDSISNILTLGKEKEVRDKLDLPTPMQFLANILGGGKE